MAAPQEAAEHLVDGSFTMTDYVYYKPKRHISLKILAAIVVTLFAVILIYNYAGLLATPMNEGPVKEDQCEKMLGELCDKCFTANGYNFDSWNEHGVDIEEDVANCFEVYFGSEIETNQGCVGLQDFCIHLI